MRNTLFVCLFALLFSCQQNQPKHITAVDQPVINDSLLIDSLSELIRKNPRQSELYSQRAKLWLKTGNYGNSRNDFTTASQLDSLNPEYYTQLADLYLQKGKSEVTRTLLLKANRLIPGNVKVLYRLGNLYFYVKEYKQAGEYLDEAIKADPFFAQAHFTKALLLKEKGDTAKAVDNLQIAVEREPDYYDAYMQLGVLYAAKPDSIALAYYRNALRVIPDSYEALYGIAMFYQENGNPEKALETYRYLLDHVDKSLPAIYYNMGYIEMEFFEDFKRGIERYDSAIIIKPDYKEAFCNRAYCYKRLGNAAKARDDYHQALKIDGEFNPAIEGLKRIQN